MEDLKHLAMDGSEKIKEKVLELIQCWAHAFRGKSEYKIVADTHNLMKLEGNRRVGRISGQRHKFL